MDDILQALAQSKAKKPQHTERVRLESGMLSISDDVFVLALERAGVNKELIKDALLEQLENRDALLNYFENKK